MTNTGPVITCICISPKDVANKNKLTSYTSANAKATARLKGPCLSNDSKARESPHNQYNPSYTCRLYPHSRPPLLLARSAVDRADLFASQSLRASTWPLSAGPASESAMEATATTSTSAPTLACPSPPPSHFSFLFRFSPRRSFDSPSFGVSALSCPLGILQVLAIQGVLVIFCNKPSPTCCFLVRATREIKSEFRAMLKRSSTSAPSTLR